MTGRAIVGAFIVGSFAIILVAPPPLKIVLAALWMIGVGFGGLAWLHHANRRLKASEEGNK